MNNLKCPICGHETEHFDDYDMTYTIANKSSRLLYKDAICQVCKSDVRHRFVFRFLQDKTNIFKKRIKVLHFAPEYWLANVFLNTDIEYHPVDIDCERFRHFDVEYVDITGIPFEDHSFDAIILVHVLEHIPEDDKAIRELYRVLKPGGWVLISVPTHNNPTESGLHLTPVERKNMYGLEDHYRLYGPDLKEKLEATGFQTDIFIPEDIPGEWYNRSCEKGYRPSDKYLFFSIKPEKSDVSIGKLIEKELVVALQKKEDLCDVYRRSLAAVTQMKNNYKAECKKGKFCKNLYHSKNLYQQKQNTNLLLTIIMVTYNAEGVVEKTLNSVFDQTFDQYELIVIDGGSTDTTTQVLQKYSDHIACLISEPDQGIYDAMNKGLVAANGQYVQFLNAGDYFTDKETLKTIFNQIVGTPMLIYGDINILHLDGRTQYHPADAFSLDNLQRRGTGILCHQAMFMLRERAPLYNLRYRYKAELNWYFDIVEKENFTYQHYPVPVVYYALGGFGYNNFIRNRLDWIFLIVNRYGLRTLWDSRLILFLGRNSLNRYPMLAKVHPYLAMIVRLLRKSFQH